MAEFTQELCDVLGLERPVLMGHDMGGAVALQMAVNQPERFRALIVVACGADVEVPEETLDQARRVSEGKERRPFDPSNFSSGTAPDVMKKAFMWGLKTDPRATYGDLLACRDWHVGEALGSIVTFVDALPWERGRCSPQGQGLRRVGSLKVRNALASPQSSPTYP